MLRKLTFFGSVATIYILTIGTIGALLYSSHLFGIPVWALTKPIPVQQKPVKLTPKIKSGIPVRIVIASSGIDLPLDPGTYDPTTQTWSLSPTDAQFALMSLPANDHNGVTFVYGHGTDAVFGKIGTNHPPAGTEAQLHTDNGQIFWYTLDTVQNLKPTDTSILDDVESGPPRLVVQTCTGIFSEWRTMFTFSLEKVTKQ